MKRSYTYLKGLLTLALSALTGWMWAATTTYTWDAEKGFVDGEGNPAVVTGDFTITAQFKMPNVSNMNSDIVIFNATKGDADAGKIGIKGWASGHNLKYVVGSTETTSGGHYSNARFYNNGEGSNTMTLTATGYDAGAVNTKFDVLWANGQTKDAENAVAGTFTDEFSITSVSLGEGVTLESASLTVTGYLPGQKTSFGVNFTVGNDTIDTSDGVGAGFSTGSYTAPVAWTNVGGAALGYTDAITVAGGTYPVVFTSRGTWNSGCGTDTNNKKLLRGYLDDTVNNGRTKATVTITGLPEDKQYAVALILSGDADNTGFNGKYSPALINGQTYSYDGTTLLTGDAAAAATTWGDRRASASANGDLVVGTNVMFVEGLSGGVLTITSAMEAQNTSRLTIAGVQVWITDTPATSATAPAFGENAEAISVNFSATNAARTVNGTAGLYAIDGWNNTSAASSSATTLTISDGEKTVDQPVSLTYSSNNCYQWDGATDALLKGYLDDGGNQAHVTVESIPFSQYSVIVYTATDTENLRFKAVQINGTNYLGSATYNPGVGYAVQSPAALASWGKSRGTTVAYGRNALRVDGLTASTLTIDGGTNSDGARGGIAAIQIVNTGDSILSDTQKITGSAEQKVSELPELTKPVVDLTLPEGATLIVDAIKEGHILNIISTGAVTIKVTNLSISQAQLNGMLNTEGVTGTVTNNFSETNGYTVGDVTYPLVYIGGTDGWSTAANWATGTRTNGETTAWIPYAGTVVPGAPNSNVWNIGLIDGDLIGAAITADEDGYKVVNTATLEGWALKMTVANGVHVKIPTLNKLQGECVIRVDESSKITVTNKGAGNNADLNKYYINAENGLVFENMALPGGTAYLGTTGSITTGTFANNQTIGGVTLALGTPAEGRKLITRTLYTYTSGTNFTVADGAVTTDAEDVEATEVITLQNVGDYKFVKTDAAYEVHYVAYAETDELDPVNVWNGAVDSAWENEDNWTVRVPAAGDDVTITVAENTTLTIPEAGVTVGDLIVNGAGTLTLAGGKITAAKVFAEGNIVASEATLALAPMDIAEGKTVTYEATTTVADPDTVGRNSALTLKDLTGEGAFVKTGAGALGLFATKAETAIAIQAGTLLIREEPTTAINVTGGANTEINLAAWNVSFTKANMLTLEGGAQLTLANGPDQTFNAAITITEATETSAKICGSSFGQVTLTGTIAGAGKVEFADGGAFGEGMYPCDNATTCSSVISGELQVIISDAQAVTFTANNTYTGGTVIAEGAVLNAATNGLGAGAVTGAGKLVINGYPANETARNSLGSADWTGLYVNTADNTMRDTGNWFGSVGNSGSSVEFSGTSTGYLAAAGSADFALIVSGSITFNNGNSSNGGYTFNGPLSGTGTLATTGNQSDVLKFLGETKDYAGTITVDGYHCIAFGEQADDDTKIGKLVVAAGKTANIAAGKTWTAVNGIEVAGTIGGEGTIGSTLILLNGATLANAMTLEGNVTVAEGTDINHAYATAAGDTVITCANADAVAAALTGAPEGLKYVAEEGAVKLALAKVNVTIPAAPANTKWYNANGEVVEAGTLSVDPNADVTLTLKADEGYVFADGSTEMEVTVNAGETGAEITAPEVNSTAAQAKIGETPYLTFAAALAAVQDGQTITLLADATITARVTIDKSITLDLNGKTIAETVEDQFGAIYVKKGATLTIAATNGGEITTDGGIVIGNYGTVIVNGGTIAAGEVAEDDVSIYNFYYQADYYGTTTVNGGTVARIWNCGIATLAGGTVADVDNSGAMTIDGAEVTNVILRDGSDAAGVEGAGTLKAAADLTVTTEEGYTAVYDAETGTWTAIDPSIGKAAKIGETYYDTFLGENGALAKAQAGDTITLLAPVTASEIITIEKAITIDGNKQTLTSTAGRAFNIDCDGSVTIQNLTIVAKERAINIINQAATVTLTGVTATADNVAVMIATSADAAEVSIDGCNFTGLMVVAVYGAGADVTIANSTIANVDANADENYGAITVGDTAEYATVEVTGTTITVMDDSKKVYNFAPTATVTGVDEVGVIVAMIGDAGYDTIEEAAKDVKAGQTIKLITDVTATKALVIAGTIDLNGKTLTADIAGTIKMNGGTFATSQYTMVGTNGLYTSTDAVFTIAANATYDMTVTAGTLTLNAAQWWTLEGQTITIGENAAIVIPAGKTLGINGSTIVVNGTATVAGEVQLLTKTSTVKAAAGLNVTTTVAGCEVKYVEGVYTVVESIVIEDVIAATPAAEAIKAAMEAVGVTEIETYTITTKGADADADADAVAAVLEVFEVTPTVDANGELTVAYEFGVSAMTNVGEVITITAGVTGAEYRAGVEVAFYANGVKIGTATTTADSTEVSITNIQAADINGKKITVKAIK